MMFIEQWRRTASYGMVMRYEIDIDLQGNGRSYIFNDLPEELREDCHRSVLYQNDEHCILNDELCIKK